MVLILALMTDTHETLKLNLDHIPRVGEKIVFPSATKSYEVMSVEYWIKTMYAGSEIKSLDNIQIILKRSGVVG